MKSIPACSRTGRLPARRSWRWALRLHCPHGRYAADSVVETDVSVKTPDGTADAALFHPGGKGAWPAVLMWPDIFGLRPVFREMGRRLAAQGYTVLVPQPLLSQRDVEGYSRGRAPIPTCRRCSAIAMPS